MKENFDHLIINKNRGWRGLAEIVIRNKEYKPQLVSIFSFSQAMWNDLLDGRIVVQDDDYYYIVAFSNIAGLPRKDQQRSVLIKNFTSRIGNVYKYKKDKWEDATTAQHYNTLYNFIKNKNNHTQSDWNCIGIRVTPMI